MPTILYVCEYGTVSGGENSLMAGIPLLAEGGYHCRVLCPERSDLSRRLAEMDIAVRPLRWRDGQGKTLPLNRRRGALMASIRQIGPDIVHANSLSVSRVLGPLTPGLDPIRTVGHLRDIINVSGQVLRDIGQLDRVLCVSEATRTHHCRRGLAEEKTRVLYNGVRIPEPAPSPNRETLVIAAIGQLVQRKGLDVLIEAMPQIAARFPAVELRIYGERYSVKEEAIAYCAAIHRRVEELGLTSNVRFMGYRADIAGALEEIDLLVHPARQEPFGRVLLEAAAAGLAIVASDVGGTREMFPHGEAELVPPDDPVSLAAAVTHLLRRPELRQLRGEQALQRAGYFSCERYAERLISHYEELLR